MSLASFDAHLLQAGSRPLDTEPDAWEVQCEIWKRLTEEDKLRIALELSQNMREMAVAGAKLRLPGATPEEIQSAVARLMLGEELWQAAYGPTDATKDCA